MSIPADMAPPEGEYTSAEANALCVFEIIAPEQALPKRAHILYATNLDPQRWRIGLFEQWHTIPQYHQRVMQIWEPSEVAWTNRPYNLTRLITAYTPVIDPPLVQLGQLDGVTFLSMSETQAIQRGTLYPSIRLAVRRKIQTPQGDRTFLILIHDATGTAGAWIAPEQNGVAILDDDEAEVLADQIDRGNQTQQLVTHEKLIRATWEAFRVLINTSGRNRHTL